jgi:hypothetical protein
MLRLFLYSMIVLCTWGICSCHKDAAEKPKIFSREILTMHPWKIKALLYREKGGTTNNDFTTHVYKPCELDDTYIFAPDSTFTREDNNDVCTSSGYFGLWGQGNWEDNDDLTELSVIETFGVINFNVLELNDSSLILEQPTKDYLQNDIIYTYEFVPE